MFLGHFLGNRQAAYAYGRHGGLHTRLSRHAQRGVRPARKLRLTITGSLAREKSLAFSHRLSKKNASSTRIAFPPSPMRVDPLRVPLFRFAPIPFLYALLTLPLEGVGESGGKASTSITYPIVLWLRIQIPDGNRARSRCPTSTRGNFIPQNCTSGKFMLLGMSAAWRREAFHDVLYAARRQTYTLTAARLSFMAQRNNGTASVLRVPLSGVLVCTRAD